MFHKIVSIVLSICLASSPLNLTFADDNKWLEPDGINAVLNGNTANATFLDGGATSIVYFSPDGKAYAKNPTSRIAYIADWSVKGNQWCMYSGQKPICYRMALEEGDTVVGWLVKGGEHERSITLQMLKGDAMKFIEKRKAAKARLQSENNNVMKAAAGLGLLLIGATLAGLAFGGSGDGGSESCPHGYKGTYPNCTADVHWNDRSQKWE